MQRDFFEIMIYSYSAIAWILGLIYSLGAAIVVYAIVRWRDSKSDRKDPQLGVKVGLHFLMSISIILAVTGGSLVVVDQLVRITGDDSSDSFNAFDPYNDYGPRRSSSSDKKILTPATRAGFAILLAGVMLAAGEWWLIFSRTNDLKWPIVRRMFTGARTLLHGLVVTVALTGALVVAFMDFEDGGSGQRQVISGFLGLLCVWGFSLAVHMSLLFLYTKQSNIPGQNFRCFDCGEDLRGHSTTQVHYCPVCKATVPMSVRRALSSLDSGQQPVMATRMTASTAPSRPSAPPQSEPPKDPPAAQ